MALAGKDAKTQVNGTSSSWNEVDARDVTFSIDPNNLDVTQHGDDGIRRIPGLVGASVDMTINIDASPGTSFTDLRDGALNGTTVSVDHSPDGNTSGGPNDVYQFEALVDSWEKSGSADSDQSVSVTLVVSDGNIPTITGAFRT